MDVREDYKPDLTDERLASDAQAGCRSSFEQLVRRYQTRLLRFLEVRCRHRQLAEDALQEAFLSAFRSLATFDSTWRFSTWLFTIAKRVESRLRRRLSPNSHESADQIEPVDDNQPEDQITARESKQALWATVRQITTRDELTALWMCYVEEMSMAEIAKIVERTPQATKMLLYRARQRVKESLQADSDEGWDELCTNKGRIAG